ncbi:hypothetical protein ACLX1H_008381 [Fusarium chlamydosporum]
MSGNPVDRLINRIESAALELGNRLGEFQDFVRTPAGQAMMAQHDEPTQTNTSPEEALGDAESIGSQEN